MKAIKDEQIKVIEQNTTGECTSISYDYSERVGDATIHVVDTFVDSGNFESRIEATSYRFVG